MLKKVARSSTLSNEIYNILKNAILQGELELGMSITESMLADMLGSSRTPVREAIKQLIGDGLIVSSSERGLKVIQIDDGMIFKNCEVRSILEHGALELSLHKHKDALIKELQKQLTIMEQAILDKNQELYNEADYVFHKAFFMFSDNDVLSSLYDTICLKVQIIRNQTQAKEISMKGSIKEHKKVLQYLQNNNIAEALNLVGQHAFNQYFYLKERDSSHGLVSE